MILMKLVISLSKEVQFKFEKDFIQVPFIAASFRFEKIEDKPKWKRNHTK